MYSSVYVSTTLSLLLIDSESGRPGQDLNFGIPPSVHLSTCEYEWRLRLQIELIKVCCRCGIFAAHAYGKRDLAQFRARAVVSSQ